MFRIFSDRKISILIVLGLCLALRLSFFVAFQPWQPQVERQQALQIDALGYHQLAENLLKNKSFSYEENGKPDGLRTPGYPLFISAIYSIFGNHPWIVLLFQIILDTLTCLVLIITLHRLFSPRVATVASIFYALDPFLIFYCSTLLSDVLFVFLLVLSFYVFATAYLSASGGKGVWLYGLCGLLLGLATLVRPVSTYLPFILAIFFFAAYWKDKKQAIKTTVICLIFFFLAISPWLIRNYLVFDRLSLSTAGQWNVLFYWAEPIEMERLNIDRASAEDLLDSRVEREMAADGLDPKEVNAFQLADYHQKVGKKIIMENPLAFARTYIKGVVFNFVNLNTEAFTSHLHMRESKLDKRWYGSTKDQITDFISRKPPEALAIGALIVSFLAIAYALSVVGLLASWNRCDRKIILFLLLMASYFVLVTGAAGVARYRLPSIPFYLCFAGIGFEYVYQRAVQRRNKSRLDSRK